jgi:oxygen-dependent protoporphyrinogen oxidase
MKIAVIGGGVSGLVSAYLISKESEKRGIKASIKLFEKESRCGGTMSSTTKDGFTVESGPNGFLDSKKETLELIKSAGLGSELLPSSRESELRFVYDGKKLWKVPEKPIEFAFSGLITPLGKARILSEIFIKKSDIPDETVGDFVRRRLGREAAEKLIDPMIRGIYAGNLDELDLDFAFHRMKELERDYGSLFKAMFKLKKGGPPPGHLTSFRNGMQELIDTIEKIGGFEVIKNFEIKEVLKNGDMWRIKAENYDEDFDKIVFTLPAYALAKIFKPVSKYAERISYQPICVVHLGYEEKLLEKKPQGFGFITLEKAKLKILGTIFSSNIFSNRAPKGMVLLSSMVGGAFNKDVLNMSDDEVINYTVNEVSRIFKSNGKPSFISFKRHIRAIPNYNLESKNMKKLIIDEIKKEKGLYLGGNAFFGIGVNDTIKRAYELSSEVFI